AHTPSGPPHALQDGAPSHRVRDPVPRLGRRTPRGSGAGGNMRTVLRAVLIMVLVGLILSAVAMASPVLILVAAGLIIIAWRWPGRLAAWLEHPALSWLPARLRASPRAFVTSAAAVLLLFALMIQLATIGEQPGSGEEMV